jgi:hypothetical protein
LKIRDAIEAAQKADAIVYVLLCADRGASTAESVADTPATTTCTSSPRPTGGRVINVGNKFDKLRDAFDQIAAELRSQYNIGFTSTDTKLDGTYRKTRDQEQTGLQDSGSRRVLCRTQRELELQIEPRS